MQITWYTTKHTRDISFVSGIISLHMFMSSTYWYISVLSEVLFSYLIILYIRASHERIDLEML